jgi:hypothetical protein
MMATNNHFVSLTEDQIRLLGELSARTGKSPAELISDALHNYSAATSKQGGTEGQPLSLSTRLSRRELLGCLDGGPPDLSTNPEHMEGIGE